jgi:hypothetical protein
MRIENAPTLTIEHPAPARRNPSWRAAYGRCMRWPARPIKASTTLAGLLKDQKADAVKLGPVGSRQPRPHRRPDVLERLGQEAPGQLKLDPRQEELFAASKGQPASNCRACAPAPELGDPAGLCGVLSFFEHMKASSA